MSSKIKITVGGIAYSVKSDESEEYLNILGNELENKIKNITRRNPCISTTMVAIIAALESADDAKKANAEIKRLKEKIEKIEKEKGGQQKMRLSDK